MNPSRANQIGHPARSGSGPAGFTLLELLVVLVVIGVMAALAVPSLLRSMSDTRLESSANRLFLDIKRAKLEASRSHVRHFIRLDSAKGKVWLRQAGPDDSTSWGSANSKGKLVGQGMDSLEAGVVFGLPADPKKTPHAIGTDLPASGISTGIPGGPYTTPTNVTGDLEDCTDGLHYPVRSPGFPNQGWVAPSSFGKAGLIVACGGAISDLNLGIVYLSADRSNNVYAISYNHLGGLSNQVRMFKYDGSVWREVQ